MNDRLKDSEEFRQVLSERYGELLGGDSLRLVLGYKSLPAFRQAVRDGRLTLKTFFVKGRQGRFALTRDVADWLLLQRDGQHDERQFPKPE